MKIQTINLPDRCVESISVMVDMGLFPSRSEFVRVALEEFIPKELQRFEQLNSKEFLQLKKRQYAKFFKIKIGIEEEDD